MDSWDSPDVAKDGSIKRDESPEREDNRPPRHKRVLKRSRFTLSTFLLRQRYAAWTLIQLVGFAAFSFGAFRLFGIGVYEMNGIGPFSRAFFTTVYLPGPWTADATVSTLAWIWMGIGVAIVGLSTQAR